VKALAYGRVLGGGVFSWRGTPVKAWAYGRVLGGGVWVRKFIFMVRMFLFSLYQGPQIQMFD